ncbi:hydrolase, TatD family protein [Orientia chuto str. Dubai]|uniref:Hydrolase, TatD family protein n=1 Tax=Orientia chuto str. Dubai TaxID=1359168 RepID=A0A0F3MP65_9RICK|nr:TatD family hydrolase [Candidatus Orientia mediorientalis]KJV57543.1 hydrolase, TatD family protein [Orientia chuto str. Dubai]
MLIDSHCHLNMLTEQNTVIKNAKANGVKYMLTVSTNLNEFPEICAITRKYSNIFSSVGVHPTEVMNYPQVSAELLSDLAQNPTTIAFGETGLDYFHNISNEHKLLQKKSFIEHIKAAHISRLPVIVHTRDSESDTYEILYNARKKYTFKAVIHCFTASQDFAVKMLELGIYISVSGIITFKNAENLRKTIYNNVPTSSLLIETDSPYLAPVPMRSKQNEPAYLVYIADMVSKIKNLSVSELAKITTNNFQDLFLKAVII